MNKSIYPAARRVLGVTVAAALVSLGACDRKEAPTCGTTDTPPCAVGTGGAPHDSGGGIEQQK